jgi:hypothetical protein
MGILNFTVVMTPLLRETLVGVRWGFLLKGQTRLEFSQ